MTPRDFCTTALHWTRSKQDFRSSVVPSNPGEDVRGIAEVPGHFVTPSSASQWAYGGLWTLTFGTILAMTALPGMSVATKAMLQQLGYGVLLLAFGVLIVAEVIRRQHLASAVLELRAATAGPATVSSIERLHTNAKGSVVWVVAENGLAEGALAAAKARNIRCFEFRAGDFRELKEEALADVLVDSRLTDDPVAPPRRRRRPAA